MVGFDYLESDYKVFIIKTLQFNFISQVVVTEIL
jgi:hypothetical protein